MGDALAQLVITPAILFWIFGASRKMQMLSFKRWAEGVLIALGITVTGYFAVHTGPHEGATFAEARFLASMPFLFWAAIRFGAVGASGAVLVMAVLSVEAALAGHGVFSGSTPAETAAQLQRFLLLRAAPLYLVAILVNQSRNNERSLRESEERMKLAAESAHLGMWEWDFASNNVWVDGRARETIAWGNDSDSDYSPFLRTVHPEDRDGVTQAVARAISGDGNYEHVHRRVLSDGQVKWIASRGRVEFDAAHKPVRMRGVGMDITARKLAEEQAKKAEAEAQRSKDEVAHMGRVSILGELTGSLAHELNQPLTAILSNAAAAQFLMDGKQGNDEGVREALKEITQEGRRAGEIIAGMRAMLRKEPGQMVAQDLNVAVREVLEMLHSDLLNRHVTPVLRLDPLLPPVNAYGVQLRQVLLNLVMNACDAMSDQNGGQRQLTVESRRLNGDEVEVSVADNGPGFSEEMLQHVFEPFHTTKPKGLGLGLAICRSIVAAHGGRLMATNENGRGAMLRLTLPTATDLHDRERGERNA
jgi:PAS domain S-box-containing protein